MANRWSEVLDEAIHLIVSGDLAGATSAFERLDAAVASYSSDDDVSLSSVWEPLLLLLDRRGYFVSGPAEIRKTFREILEMGAGFDLFDLSAAVAKCDRSLAHRLNAPTSRIFPELRPFVG